ncbi:MAG: Checkpoint serine/threonine-protein kinase BUB1 [Amphiamblys sp. WSBS2006]|nr:MAG: Checkpoint serine/threonine-protein kinase BUB1 [Amphiamblys sp. WSBS2006]
MLVEDKKKHFKELIERIDEADDPLGIYSEYISTLQTEEGTEEYRQALQDCALGFSDDARYKNDPRYIRCFVQYAGVSESQEEVYLFMRDKGIGTSVGLYYEQYSRVLEKEGRVEEAIGLLRDGVDRKAAPTKKLEQALTELSLRHRAVRHREIKGYDENLLQGEACFEEVRARRYEGSIEDIIADNGDDTVFLSSDNSNEMVMPPFPLVAGIKEEDYTLIDIYKDSTVDTKELCRAGREMPENVLKERVVAPPLADKSVVVAASEETSHSEALSRQDKAAIVDGIKIEEPVKETVGRVDAALQRGPLERPVFVFCGESLFVQKKVSDKGGAKVYRCLCVGGKSSLGWTENIAVKTKDSGLAGEWHCLSALKGEGISPTPHCFIRYLDSDILVAEGIDTPSLFRVRELLENRRDRECVSLTMFFSLRIVQAVLKMHRRGIVHGNLSCENILPVFGEAGDSVAGSFQAESSEWGKRGVRVCGFGQAVDRNIVTGEVTGMCRSGLCSGSPHSTCFEADLHGTAWSILELLFPSMQATGTLEQLQEAIVGDESTEKQKCKQLWKDVLVLLLNTHRTKEECFEALVTAERRIEETLVKYDSGDEIDRLRMALRRLEMDVYESTA